MLPKVATQILHHTSRAAVVAQNQTSHTIRNVLQLQTSSGASTSSGALPNRNGPSSNHYKGDNGTRPGGPKFAPGSPFQNHSIGANCAASQSNVPIEHDRSFLDIQETDEPSPKIIAPQIFRPRRRSDSLAVGRPIGHRPSDGLAISETIQRHARARHAFTQPSPQDHSGVWTPPTSQVINGSPTSLPINDPSARQSVDSIQAPDALIIHSILPVIEAKPKPLEVSPEPRPTRSSVFQALRAARDSGDHNLVISEITRFRESKLTPSILEFSIAIEALCKTRRPGDSLAPILDVYNDMLKLSLRPSIKTCLLLIQVLTDRDDEVHRNLARLEARRRSRTFTHSLDDATSRLEDQVIAQLRAEENFSLASSLFKTIIDRKGNDRIPVVVYNNILRSCSHHSDVDMAVQVFSQLERRLNISPFATVFGYLIDVYGKAGDIQGANEIFSAFKASSGLNQISRAPDRATTETARHLPSRKNQLSVWNKMIEAYFRCGQPAGALSLLEQMMDTTANEHYGPADTPPPDSSTFNKIIEGFCRSADVATALIWFDRLLQQGQIEHQSTSFVRAVQPDQFAWRLMLETLTYHGMTTELNRLFLHLVDIATPDGLEIFPADRLLVFQANLNDVEAANDNKSAVETLDFLLESVVLNEKLVIARLSHQRLQVMMSVLVSQYLKREARGQAFRALEKFVDLKLKSCHEVGPNNTPFTTSTYDDLTHIREVANSLSSQLLSHEPELSLQEALRLMRVLDKVGLLPTRASCMQGMQAYTSARASGLLQDLTLRDWELLTYAITTVEFPADQSGPANKMASGTLSILQDLAAHKIDPAMIPQSIIHRIINVLSSTQDATQLSVTFKSLGNAYEKVLRTACNDLGVSVQLTDPLHTTGELTALNVDTIRIDKHHSRFVDEFFPYNPNVTPLMAYARYEIAAQNNLFPDPSTIGRLIGALGRLGEIDKLRKLYLDAQRVLASLEQDKKWQSQAWFNIEDQMIIACAHAGDLQSAHMHRERILNQGGVPTADSYGALIECVKDTTDDTSNSMALFQEARKLGVLPNLYLYNNIISKLAKARKADLALELFHQLKSIRLQPSSITYGAVIAACARVGDAYSAEILFTEMVQQRNYKPRIPPFNTMMQLYVQTKPNRDRLLYYYNALVTAGIQPTAHTYKLLIDAYGSIEPVDVQSMERVFRQLENDSHVQIQGNHWAAVINAWGCVKKDLDKAMATFESIVHHPSTRTSPTVLPDAVTFEALINVLVAHRRTDLIPQYLERLETLGVHMTAYIANCLIKGYAAVDDLEQSRRIFESLQDPPEGVAAPSNHVPNHVPHRPSSSSAVPVTAPVYREPSTWEAMVRAELGNGNRDSALELLDRMQARKFPDAVCNRIRGIMFIEPSTSLPNYLHS